MSLSELTHATVEQIKQEIRNLCLEYERGLRKIRLEILYPARDETKRLNAELRKRIAVRRRSLERYLDARLAEGPSE